MKNIREIVANNIVTLRKQNGLTQIQLSEKINYSDKAISRWEKGEVLPDVETLQSLAGVFDVPIAYLLEEHQEENIPNCKHNMNKVALTLVSICVVWLIATIIFAYLLGVYQYSWWQAFVWAVPVSALVGMYYNFKWGNRIVTMILMSVFVWTIVASFYLQFLSWNLWLLFLIAIPLQAVVTLSWFIKPRKK